MDYNFIVKEIMNFIFSTTHTYTFHIDMTTLDDGTYELVPESNEGGNSEAHVNQAVITKDLSQSLVADLTNTAQEVKPRA